MRVAVMLNLTTPTDQQNPHHWAATLGAHSFIGAMLWALLVHTGWPIASGVFVCVVYFFWWEVAVQKQAGANLDAIIDTWAVAMGVWFAYAVWYHDLLSANIASGGWLAVAGVGVWRRL